MGGWIFYCSRASESLILCLRVQLIGCTCTGIEYPQVFVSRAEGGQQASHHIRQSGGLHLLQVSEKTRVYMFTVQTSLHIYTGFRFVCLCDPRCSQRGRHELLNIQKSLHENCFDLKVAPVALIQTQQQWWR